MHTFPTVSKITKISVSQFVNYPSFNYKHNIKANRHTEPQWKTIIYTQVSAVPGGASLCDYKLKSLICSPSYAS